jgi:hypothetical protein
MPLLLPIILVLLSLSMLVTPARASQAYGSINNFDVVNDTGVTCHGFEIEIMDARSKDITYTYDYNHYGVPKISEDTSDPVHPRAFVRYQSSKNSDGTWASYTAVPSGPISPTMGHQFTNPSVNFGGEHFGVGFYGNPASVKYSWLKDDGTGNLVFAGAVIIATPSFTYIPPVVPAAPPQVQAAIVPPPPPAPPILEFGTASWVKETRTSTHNNGVVKIEDLVSDDPADPAAKSWRNGEPDEVEVEWQLLQTDYNAGNGGANGVMNGAPEDLPNGDEVITRRYDFYKYVGPIDPDTGEALADVVAADGKHGVGVVTVNGVDTDLSTVVIVGDYVGAQMAGFDAAAKIGLIDHVQEGLQNDAYPDRSIVVGGTSPIINTLTGALPNGLSFNAATGVLSGTPTESGSFQFTVHSTDASNGDVTKNYTLVVVSVTQVTSFAPTSGPVLTNVVLTGAGFTGATSVTVNGVGATFTVNSDTRLTLTVPANATTGTISVTGPNGAASTLTAFTVYRTPTVSSISPTSITAGSGPFTLSVSGTGFLPSSRIYFAGQQVATTYVNATSVRAIIPSLAVASGVATTVSVTNLAPGSGKSNAVSFIVNNPVPIVGSVASSPIPAGTGKVTIVVNGSRFVPTSIIKVGLSALKASFVNATTLTVPVPMALASGGAGLTVVNPAPQGGASNAVLLPTVTVTAGGFVRVPRTAVFTQTVTVANTSLVALQGPVSLFLDSLSANATLSNAAGSVLGSPYVIVTAGNLPSGSSGTVILKFSDPTLKSITYTPRVTHN